MISIFVSWVHVTSPASWQMSTSVTVSAIVMAIALSSTADMAMAMSNERAIVRAYVSDMDTTRATDK